MRLGTSDRWRICYRYLVAGQVIASTVITGTAIALKTDIPATDQNELNLWWTFVAALQVHSLPLFIIATCVLWSSQIINRYFGNPWVMDLIKFLLEELRSDVFKGREGVSAAVDRVTLFQWRNRRWRWCIWPCQGWLCAIERTGHMTRLKRRWFRVKDDARNPEGVAGATWCQGSTIFKEALPNMITGANDASIKKYARETFITSQYVRAQIKKGAVLPRSLCGIIVEVESKPWGVIVIDSAIEKLTPGTEIEAFFKKHGKVLGKLLAKV